MATDPAYDSAPSLASLLAATAVEGNRPTPSPGPVTVFVRRLGWEMHPSVYLRYDADEDVLLARFVPAVTAAAHTVDEQLYVGFDGAADDSRCTVVCLTGFLSDPTGRRADWARQVLGEAVWSAASSLAARGSGDRTVILGSRDVAGLLVAWSGFKKEFAPIVSTRISDDEAAENSRAEITAMDRRTAVRRKGTTASTFMVDVISVTDSEIADVLAQWSAEFAKVGPSQGHTYRGLLQTAIHRGISSLRAGRQDASGEPDRIVRGEWDLPDLFRMGVHSRVAWQIEPGDPPVLVVRATRIEPLRAGMSDIEHRIEVRFGDQRDEGASAPSGRGGDLAVRGRRRFGLTKVGRVRDPAGRGRRRLRSTKGGRISRVRNRSADLSRYCTERGRRILIRSVRGVGQAVPDWTRRRRSR